MFCKIDGIITHGNSPISTNEDSVDELCRILQDLINQVPKGSNVKIGSIRDSSSVWSLCQERSRETTKTQTKKIIHVDLTRWEASKSNRLLSLNGDQ